MTKLRFNRVTGKIVSNTELTPFNPGCNYCEDDIMPASWTVEVISQQGTWQTTATNVCFTDGPLTDRCNDDLGPGNSWTFGDLISCGASGQFSICQYDYGNESRIIFRADFIDQGGGNVGVALEVAQSIDPPTFQYTPCWQATATLGPIGAPGVCFQTLTIPRPYLLGANHFCQLGSPGIWELRWTPSQSAFAALSLTTPPAEIDELFS